MKKSTKTKAADGKPKPGDRVQTMPFGYLGEFVGWDRHGRALVAIDGKGSVPEVFHPGNVTAINV